jgi:hypothetical protein
MKREKKKKEKAKERKMGRNETNGIFFSFPV